jgi:hypothetical protein
MRKLIFLFAAGLSVAAVALPASAAITPTAPTVVTGSASVVTEAGAVVTGTVTANGAPTTYSFQYGLTTSYGSSTPSHVIWRHGHESVRTVFARVGGLTAGTLYHFRLVASNSAGTSNGADQTFTTIAALAPAVTTGSALNITQTSASVDGTLSPQGSATTFYFQYGTTTAYGSQTVSRTTGPGQGNRPVIAFLGGLTANTPYHFRLVATNAAGTTDGADATFSTLAAPVPAAPIVTTGSALRIRPTSALIDGTLSPQGAATTYSFEYGTTTAYGSQTVSRTTGPGWRSRPVFAFLRGLTPNTPYHFRLVATNSAGTTDGSDATFTTLPAVVPPPQHEWFAGSVSAVGANSLTVGVLWTGPHDGSLDGQTLTVSVQGGTVIKKGEDGRRFPIALSQIQPNDLVAINASGTAPSALVASKIVDYCNCHFISGTIGTTTSTPSDSFTVQVQHTGPYDTVLQGQLVTLQTSGSTIYLQGRGGWRHITPISFADLTAGEHIAVIFAANGFFKAPGFNPATATFTASRAEVWGQGVAPITPLSPSVSGAAQTSVSG